MIRQSAMITSTKALAALLLASAAMPAAAQDRVEVGNVASVAGEVRLAIGAAGQPRAAQRRQRVAWGDRIETGRESQAQILLLDRTTFGIGARSRVTIDRYVYDPDAGRSLLATLARGALRFFSGRPATGNNTELQTPAGRIGIRGTALDLLVGEHAREIGRNEGAVTRGGIDPEEATLVVLRGPGQDTLGGLTPGLAEVTSGGVTVVLDQPGQAAFIPRAGAAPIGPFRISDAGLARVQARMSPAVAEARGGDSFLDNVLPVAVGAAAVVGAAILLSDDDDRQSPTGTSGTSVTGGQDNGPPPPGTSSTAPTSPNNPAGNPQAL